MSRQTIVKIFGIIFMLGAIYIAFCGVSNYIKQLEQKDWRVVMATVTQVQQRKESVGGRKSHHKTVYDISYEYYFNSDLYSGEIIGTVTPKALGDHFDVKCDPQSPSISTHILDPLPDALIANILGGFMFAAVGLWISGILPLRDKDSVNRL